MKNDDGSPRLYNIVQSPQSSFFFFKLQSNKKYSKTISIKNEVFRRPHHNQLTTVISPFIPSNLAM